MVVGQVKSKTFMFDQAQKTVMGTGLKGKPDEGNGGS